MLPAKPEKKPKLYPPRKSVRLPYKSQLRPKVIDEQRLYTRSSLGIKNAL